MQLTAAGPAYRERVDLNTPTHVIDDLLLVRPDFGVLLKGYAMAGALPSSTDVRFAVINPTTGVLVTEQVAGFNGRRFPAFRGDMFKIDEQTAGFMIWGINISTFESDSTLVAGTVTDTGAVNYAIITLAPVIEHVKPGVYGYFDPVSKAGYLQYWTAYHSGATFECWAVGVNMSTLTVVDHHQVHAGQDVVFANPNLSYKTNAVYYGSLSLPPTVHGGGIGTEVIWNETADPVYWVMYDNAGNIIDRSDAKSAYLGVDPPFIQQVADRPNEIAVYWLQYEKDTGAEHVFVQYYRISPFERRGPNRDLGRTADMDDGRLELFDVPRLFSARARYNRSTVHNNEEPPDTLRFTVQATSTARRKTDVNFIHAGTDMINRSDALTVSQIRGFVLVGADITYSGDYPILIADNVFQLFKLPDLQIGETQRKDIIFW